MKEGFTMRLGNQKKKKNNKGFSLVELIVVVLIIAIIAVALAPQVMKWVGTAKDNVDANNAATIKSAALIGYTEFTAAGHTLSDATTNINVNPTNIPEPTLIPSPKSTINHYIAEVLNGEYPKTKDGKDFIITISKGGAVAVVTPAPITNP